MTAEAPRWKRLLGPGTLVPVLLIAALGGNRLYMNVRPADPLPAGFVAYSAATWEELRAAGTPVLVDVYASWCPTCKAQHAVLANLLDDPKYRNVRGMRVDFDRDDAFRQRHDVRRQSMILMFIGDREISRSLGLTSSKDIRAQVDAVAADIP